MRRRLLALAALVVIVAACSGSSDGTAGPTTQAEAGSTTTDSTRVVPKVTAPPGDAPNAIFATGYPKVGAGICDGHQPGKAHVLMTFCHGPAKFTVTIGTTTRELAGICWVNGGELEVDAGSAPGEGWTGPWPDGLTARLNGSTGSYRDSLALFAFDGTRTFVTNAHGTLGTGTPTAMTAGIVAAKGFAGTIEGNDSATQAKVSVTFTCS